MFVLAGCRWCRFSRLLDKRWWRLFLFFLTLNLPLLCAAEFEIVDKLVSNGAATFKSSATIIVPVTQPASIWASTSTVTPHLYVSTTGRVGIGTGTPDQNLTVAGNISQTGVVISSGTGNSYFAGNIGIGTTTTNIPLMIRRSLTDPPINVGSLAWYDAAYIVGTLSGTNDSYWSGLAGLTIHMANSQQSPTHWNGVYGVGVAVKTTNDGIAGQEAYGMESNTETHPGDIGYNFYAEDADNSTGGTNYGLYIKLDNSNVGNYGIYQVSANNNYLAGKVGIGTNNPDADLHVVGISSFTDKVYIPENKIYVNGGATDQVLKKHSGGYLYWANDASGGGGGGGDNFGSHVATKTIDMSGHNVVDVGSITFNSASSNVAISSAPPSQYGGVYVSTNVWIAGPSNVIAGYAVKDVGDTSPTLTSADFGKTIIITPTTARTITLPATTADDIGATITVIKMAAFKVTITANGDTIGDSSVGGTVYNNAILPYYAVITLRLVSASQWIVISGDGAWVAT